MEPPSAFRLIGVLKENFIDFFLARGLVKTRSLDPMSWCEEKTVSKEIAEHLKILTKFSQPGKRHDEVKKINSKHESHHFL